MARISSWTVKHLSFAERLQLIQSVLFSIINFWTSVFLLPKSCLASLEKICNPSLWKGVPTSARGAKVPWKIVCTSKEEGGLGLRRLEGFKSNLWSGVNWLLFAGYGSLWVAWIDKKDN